MLYHEFHPLTGEHIGSFKPQVDPLESKSERKIVYCRPGRYVTDIAPPDAAPGKANVFAQGRWFQVSDHRGETWFDGDVAVVITAPGDPADLGLTPEAPPEAPPKATADNVKAECRRRIFAVADDTAQMNMASHAAAGLFSDEKRMAYLSALQWVAEMRGACRGLVATGNPAFTTDAAWPACPPDAAALAANY